MSYRKRNYLVTGATGFIGRRLVERLAREDLSIHCVVTHERSHASRLPAIPGVIPIEVDMTNHHLLHRAMETIKPDVVINLAAQGVQPADRDGYSLLAGNAGILAHLLGSLEEFPPRIFLHMGSWSEYAGPVDADLVTEDHPLDPLSLYGAAKAAASIYGNALARQLEIPFIVLRLFNVFGVGERQKRLIPYLIDCLSRDEPAELTQGNQTRDFVYADDIVEAILVAANTEHLPPNVYNVCSGRPVDVRLVAETVADIMGKPQELLDFGARPTRVDEPLWMVGDNSRFTSATPWRPEISLEEGILRMVEAGKAVGVGSGEA